MRFLELVSTSLCRSSGGLADFGRRDVLPLPSESVANSIFEAHATTPAIAGLMPELAGCRGIVEARTRQRCLGTNREWSGGWVPSSFTAIFECLQSPSCIRLREPEGMHVYDYENRKGCKSCQKNTLRCSDSNKFTCMHKNVWKCFRAFRSDPSELSTGPLPPQAMSKNRG